MNTNVVEKLECVFTDQDSLYSAYMPFIKGGGLFLRTPHFYQLGTLINLSVKLMNEVESYAIEGRIVWITPKGAQNNRLPGIGVQFLGENSRYLYNKIETYLAGMLNSRTST